MLISTNRKKANITLTESELLDAIGDYVRKKLPKVADSELEVDFMQLKSRNEFKIITKVTGKIP